ncbi:toxin-activating lysine-acyltransferase [Thalassobius sp. Cn5-15]|uniref:toxin-activating lysine-acyltransferase n=1 Tax=Thalassobius sp. Cn5-15 TaxID=2917763 RepID=UPI001EF219C4|nr:toxin-activating lysine-acyltransferase [Thalassobius sp. Cn5-15]MCG7495031.1 toxin-activating lysine-acyltransferase [Thalassobius sp. Cn5-15]
MPVKPIADSGLIREIYRDDPERILSILNSELDLTFASSFASKITKQSVYKSRGTSDLAASYGEGYALTRLTLQITDDPLTQGEVEKVLGWLRGYEEWLRVVFSDGRDLDGLGEVGKKVGAEPFSTFLCPQGQKPTASTPCPMTSQATLPLPRYRHQTLADLQHLVLGPLIRDRLAIAYPVDKERGDLADITGLAIWASVSEEVDAKIRNGVWPLRLKAEDWTSGEISWLIDVIAPDRKTTASVLGNFKQVVKTGDLRLHPIIGRLVDKETLEKMGASQK